MSAIQQLFLAGGPPNWFLYSGTKGTQVDIGATSYSSSGANMSPGDPLIYVGNNIVALPVWIAGGNFGVVFYNCSTSTPTYHSFVSFGESFSSAPNYSMIQLGAENGIISFVYYNGSSYQHKTVCVYSSGGTPTVSSAYQYSPSGLVTPYLVRVSDTMFVMPYDSSSIPASWNINGSMTPTYMNAAATGYQMNAAFYDAATSRIVSVVTSSHYVYMSSMSLNTTTGAFGTSTNSNTLNNVWPYYSDESNSSSTGVLTCEVISPNHIMLALPIVVRYWTGADWLVAWVSTKVAIINHTTNNSVISQVGSLVDVGYHSNQSNWSINTNWSSITPTPTKDVYLVRSRLQTTNASDYAKMIKVDPTTRLMSATSDFTGIVGPMTTLTIGACAVSPSRMIIAGRGQIASISVP